MSVALILLGFQAANWALPAARPCTAAEIADLTALAVAGSPPFR